MLSLLLVPFYIHYLGLEAYGLVGFFVLIETLIGIFSKSIGVTFQREIARRDVDSEGRRTFRRLIRTFEIVYWGVGLGAALALVAFSGLLAKDWINVNSLPLPVVKMTLMLVALRIGLVMPKILYSASFLGTRKQAFGSMLETSTVLASAVGQVIVVGLTKSIVGFMTVQVAAATLNLLLFRFFMTKRVLPPLEFSEPARFDIQELRNLRSFALNMMWANGIGIILLQMDRFFISKILPLAELGIYNIATAGGRLLNIFIGPILIAIYPTTCQIAMTNEKSNLNSHIERNLKITLVIGTAVAVPLCFFSREVLLIWIRKPEIVEMAHSIITTYTIGALIFSYANVFYLAQKAMGKLIFMSASNGVALLWYPFVMNYLLRQFGLIGAAWANVLYSAIELLVGIAVLSIGIIKSFSLIRHMVFFIFATIGAAAFMQVFKWLALYFFPGSPVGRLAFAALGGLVIFMGLYLVSFGRHLPQEVKSFLNTRLF